MVTALLCTDGSDLARASLVDGLRVLGEPQRVVLVTAVSAASPVAAFGGGTGRRMSTSAEGDEEVEHAETAAARAHLEETARALNLRNAEQRVVVGSAGDAICALAEALPASVIVLGTRGHGGIRRAVLGSVSDHVVRHAPCPVVITGPAAE